MRWSVVLITSCLISILIYPYESRGQIDCHDTYQLEVLQIIPNDDVDGKYIIGRPVEVIVDKGTVYVLDKASSTIKVYEENGSPERIIGSRGRGPGEFKSVDAATIVDSSLYVADNMQRRFTELDLNGNVLNTYRYNDVDGVRVESIQEMEEYDKTIVALHSVSRPTLAGEDRNVIHILSSDFKLVKSLGSIKELNIDSDFEIFFTSFDPGEVMTLSQSLYFTTGLFQGQIYTFKNNEGWVSEAHTLEANIVNREKVYKTVEYEGADSYDYMKFMTANKKIAGRPIIMNNGLFKSGNTIVRLTYKNSGETGEMFIEKINNNGTRIMECGSIEYDTEKTIYPPNLQVFSRTEAGVYYAIDRTSAPVVKAFRLHKQ